MNQPKTKTVLGRVFAFEWAYAGWLCQCTTGCVLLEERLVPSWSTVEYDDRWRASIVPKRGDLGWVLGYGPTEADAILALQATLRKMAELEVVDG